MRDAELIDVRVVCLREEAPQVVSVELRAVQGVLPGCPPGAHIDLHLPNGLIRQYSVVSASADTYLLAVKRERESRGGSTYVAESLRIGQVLGISAPRETFSLAEDDRRSVLIAGGIGITPLLAMARKLESEGRDWTLYYTIRDRSEVVFADPLKVLGPKVKLHESRRQGRLSLEQLVAAEGASSNFYCCGPASMLDAFAASTKHLPPTQVRMERFTATAGVAGGSEFEVRLARSGKTIPISADQTIVEALLGAGLDVPYSCQQGICGSCETKVLQGIPEHRDDVLPKAEKERNTTMMICCSRALTPLLVLDL